MEKLAHLLERKHREKDREKSLQESRFSIESTPLITRTSFYCSHCRKDYGGIARRYEESMYGLVAFYAVKCPCGKVNKRRIGVYDPFHDISPIIKRQRIEHAMDALQPHQTGFNMLYGNKTHDNV